MTLDHVRDFFHAGAMAFSPEDLARTTPILFFTVAPRDADRSARRDSH